MASAEQKKQQDLIAAVATPPGRGGIGIVRCSGAGVPQLAHTLLQKTPRPRKALHANFYSGAGAPIDAGIALYFPAPRSFTGEDVLELQGHGGPVVLDMVLRRCLELGARLAEPGEFSRRAFINGKLDLAQAEAVADLIASGSEQAARSAMRSLQGEFSRRIQSLISGLVSLRVQIEGAIDFPEEDVEFLNKDLLARADRLIGDIDETLHQAQAGQRLHTGISIALVGPPNAGKSSLLNHFAQQNCAIVSPVPGTTRDVLRQHIQLNGLPVEVVDTAGLRATEDAIEAEGMRRARTAIEQADVVLLLIEDGKDALMNHARQCEDFAVPTDKTILVLNKIDLSHGAADWRGEDTCAISIKSGAGLTALKAGILGRANYASSETSPFMARRRHLDALTHLHEHTTSAKRHLVDNNGLELAAEELRLAQLAGNTITGEFVADDLLGEIFSRFCIGK